MDFIMNHSSLFICIGVIALLALIGYYADKKDSKKNNTSKPVTKGSDVESSVSSQSENNNAPEVLEDKPEVLNFDVPESVSEPSVPETLDISANDAVETPVAAAPEFTSDLSDFLINPDDPNVYSANNNVQMAPGSYVAPVSPIGVVPGTPVINPVPVNPVPVVDSVPEPVSPIQGSTVSPVAEPVSIPEQPVATPVETPVYETPVVNEVPVQETEPVVTSSEFFANEAPVGEINSVPEPVVSEVETPVSEIPVVNEVPIEENVSEPVEQSALETTENVSTVSEPMSPVGNLYVSSSFENVDMSLEDLEKKNYEKIMSKKSVEKEDDDSENYFYSDLDDGVSESYDETSVDNSNEQSEVSESNVEENTAEPDHFSELVVDNDVPTFNQEVTEPATDFQPIPDLDNTIPEVNQNQESVPDLNSGVVSENFDFNSSSDNMWNF